MQRRDLLKIMIAGPSIVKLLLDGKTQVLPKAKPTGYPDVGQTKRLILVNGISHYHIQHGVEAGRWIITQGKSIIVLPRTHLRARVHGVSPLAVDFAGLEPIHHYDPESKEFKNTMMKSRQRDSKCCHGMEMFLNIDGEDVAYYCVSQLTRQFYIATHGSESIVFKSRTVELPRLDRTFYIPELVKRYEKIPLRRV